MKSNRLSNLPVWVEVATLSPGDVIKLEWGDSGASPENPDGDGHWGWGHSTREGAAGTYWVGEHALPLWVVCQREKRGPAAMMTIETPIPTVIVSLEDGQTKHAPKYAWDYTETVEVKVRDR